MAVVNSDILRIIAFNDYKHDQGGTKPKVLETVSPTLPGGRRGDESEIFTNEEETMNNILPWGRDGKGPGENLSNWSKLGGAAGVQEQRWSGNTPEWGKFSYIIKPLYKEALDDILTGNRLNLVVDNPHSNVSAAAKGCERINWVETVETLYDPLPKVVQNQASAAPGTYWGREDPNHVSFFPAWDFKKRAVAVNKINPLEKMFFSKYDLSLYMQKHPKKEGVFTSFMYYSPAPGKCILIEGTGGITRSSLTAKNGNLELCDTLLNFTDFKADTIRDGVQKLNEVWDLIKSTLSHGPNKEKIIETITLAAQNYHPPHFVVGKRLGDESQALACLRDLKIVTYGPDAAARERDQKGMPYVNVFVTYDRLALSAALYYRVPAVIFSWGLTKKDKKTRETVASTRSADGGNPGGAFIAYRSELDTPETQYKGLVARIAETLSDAPPAEPDADVLKELTDINAVMGKIHDQITAANEEINKWIKLDPRFHHQTTASGGSLSEAYKMLLGLMIYVPGIQQFSLARRLHSQIRDLGEVREEMSPMMRPILNSKTKNPPPKVTGEKLEELVNNVQKFYDTEITYRNTIKKYNASKEGINKQAAAADFSHISLKGPHLRRERKKGKKIVRGGEGLEEKDTDKDERGIANRADGAIAALEAIDDDTVTELSKRITQNPLLSLPEILTGRTILLSILEALQLLPDKNALSKDFLNTIVDVLHAFWVAASKKFSNKLQVKRQRKPPAASRWIKGTGSPPSGGLIDFISKGLPEDRTQGSLHKGLKEIEDNAVKQAAQAKSGQQSDIRVWAPPQSGGRRVKRKRKQTGGANGNQFLEYDCKIKTYVALYLVATYTGPPPSVSPDAATYPQEKGILIPLRDGGYGYASSVNFDPKLVGKAMDYCEKIQFETVKASEAAAKDDDDGAVVDGGDAGGAPREEEGGIIYNHIAHQYNEVWGDDATDTNKLNNVESAKVWVKEMQDQTKKALDDVWSEWNKLTTPVELAPPAAAGDAVAAAVGKEEEEFAARDKGSQRGRVFPGLKPARWASVAAIPRGRVAFAPAAAVAAAGGKRTKRRKRKKKQTRRRKYKKKKRSRKQTKRKQRRKKRKRKTKRKKRR